MSNELTPEQQRKIVVVKADEAVGKANRVIEDLSARIKALATERARVEADREKVLAWKKRELRKLRGEPLDNA